MKFTGNFKCRASQYEMSGVLHWSFYYRKFIYLTNVTSTGTLCDITLSTKIEWHIVFL